MQPSPPLADPILTDLQNRLLRAKVIVQEIERAIEIRKQANAASEAALRSVAAFSGGASSEEAQSGATQDPRQRTLFGRGHPLNPGRSWTDELRKAIAKYPNGAPLGTIVEEMRLAGMNFGHHNPRGLVSTKLIEGQKRGHFAKAPHGNWTNSPTDPRPIGANPYLHSALNADGRTWAQCVDEVLSKATKPMKSSEIAAALVKQGRTFGKSKPAVLVRSVLRLQKVKHGWVKTGPRWSKPKL